MAVYYRPDTYPAHLRNGGADWLDWAMFVSQCFEDAGFTNVYRQAAWAGVSAPAVVNTVANVEIWAFNDSLQATYPIFLKVRYGSGAVGAAGKGSGALHFTLADDWDGVSDLTGPGKSAEHSLLLLSNTTAVSSCGVRISASAAEGRFAYANVDNTNAVHCGAFCVERTRNANGLTSNGAILGILNMYTTTYESVGLYWPRTSGGTAHSGIAILLGENGKNQGGSLTAVSPWYVFHGPAMPPPISFIVTDSQTGSLDGTLDVPLYGVTREYLNLGAGYASSSQGRHGNTTPFGSTNTSREWMLNV